MFSTLFLEFQNWALISGEWGAGWCLTGVFYMIQMLIKNTLREVKKLSYTGNSQYIKRGRKYQKYILRMVGNHPNGF